MLSWKPWKLNAIARLVVGVLVCIFAGLPVIAALSYKHHGFLAAVGFYGLAALAVGFSVATLLLIWKPWLIERLVRRIGITAGCFYASLVAGLCVQHLAGTINPTVGQMLVAVLCFQGAAAALVGIFVREHGVTWVEAFGLNNQIWRALLLGLGLACVFLPFGLALQWVSAKILLLVHLVPQEQQTVETLKSAKGWTAYLALGLATIAVAPVAEELLFRGILYPWTKQLGFPRLALGGTSLLFAAIHFNLVSFLPLALLALALALLYEWTDNLLAPIAAHAAFNALNFAMLLLLEGPLSKFQ